MADLMTPDRLAGILFTERRRALGEDSLEPLAEMPPNLQAMYRRFAAAVAKQLDLPREAEEGDQGCLVDVLTGSVLIGADDAIGMLRALVPELVEIRELTAEQAARVHAGLDKQAAELDGLRAELEGHRQALMQAIGAPDLPWQFLLNRTRIDYAGLIRQRNDARTELAQVLRNYEVLQGTALTLEAERDEARVEAGQLREEAQTQGRLRRAEHRDVQTQRTRAAKAEAERDVARAAIETFKAPDDFHNAEHRARRLDALTETIAEMTLAGRPPRVIAEAAMLAADAAIWSVEREHARMTELAELVNAGAEACQERTRQAEGERDQLRYERRILAAARTVLDQVAIGGLRGWAQARPAAEDLAQRITDEIGHPVTDEPALGPSYREQVASLGAEVDRLTNGIRALHARCTQGARDNGEYYERVPEAKYELGKAAVWDGVAELLRELVPSMIDAAGQEPAP